MGKPKGSAANLRPITLLNTIQKLLSIIALTIIRPDIEKYLSVNQLGFDQKQEQEMLSGLIDG